MNNDTPSEPSIEQARNALSAPFTALGNELADFLNKQLNSVAIDDS